MKVLASRWFLTSPLGKLPNFQHVSAVFFGFCKGDGSRAGLPFSCGPVSARLVSDAPSGRLAAVNAVLWFFLVCYFLFSLCRQSKREFALQIPHVTTEQEHRCDVYGRDAVVRFLAI